MNYLPKEAEAELIGQFRPISILDVDGNIFMGIIARRTVTYLQQNGYVDERVQKAGTCILYKEHDSECKK